MKVTLIANLSANGKVLLAENPQHAAPQEALGFFVQKANEIGNLIIGRKTFEVLQQFPGGIKQFFPNVEVVLLSRSNIENKDFKVFGKPEEAINFLKGKGFNEIIIGGGAHTYNAFLEHDLITDIYFNFIPMVIGDGGIIGVGDNLNLKFKITEQKPLTNGIAQIHLSKI
ncbi:MAG TPA: dihydrofolate reductase [Mucilaginibacter sp.]|jgi:dihydrofolate reductase